MALLWCDGFDHYGTDETNMTDGVYATVGFAADLDTTIFNTGTASVHIQRSSTNALSGIRKVLPAATDKLGMAGRFYFAMLPTSLSGSIIFSLLTSSPSRSQIDFIVDANGCIRVYRGGYWGSLDNQLTDGTLIAQSDPIVVPEAWNHIECQAYIHDTDGWVRVAVNGVHRFEATSLDTKYDTSNVVSIAQHIPYSFSSGDGRNEFRIDDYYVYDFVGSSATDTDFVPTTDGGTGVATGYIGELQVMYLPPNGDTAETDWVRSAGSNDYETVDELDPNDADYISSSTAGDLTEFDLTDLPEDITYIRGLQLLGRMSKSDSGAALIKYGMKSVAATADSAAFPITTTPTYWWTFQNTDPNSTSRWTRASLNAAWFRLTRDT